MKSETLAKLIGILPQGLVKICSKKLVNYYLNKYADLHIEGGEKLNHIQRPTIFVCNHLSNSDGLILDRALKPVDPTFVAGVKLKTNALTQLGMHVVKTTSVRPDSADKEGLKKMVDLVKSGESLLIFPEGTRSRSGKMLQARKGIYLLARMTGAPIVPLGLWGSENLLPVDQEGNMGAESFQHARVDLKIGDQFDLPKRSKDMDKKVYAEWVVTFIMEKIADLVPEDYQGYYSKKVEK